MRELDIKSLREAYNKLPPDQRVNVPLDLWGIAAPSICLLQHAIFEDLSPTTYGIGWWSQYSGLGAKKRIFVSDYLYQCCTEIESNLIEAKIHLLQANYFGDLIREGLRGVVSAKPDGTISTNHRPKDSIDEHIQDHLKDMNTAGFFRAIGSIFDCLSSVIAGVTAMPINIFSCGHTALMKKRDDMAKNKQLHPLQVCFFEKFDNIIGQDGWLAWTLAYRNMLIHRGRMIQMTLLDSYYVEDNAKNLILTKEGLPVLWTKPISFLPREPDLSELEVLRNDLEGLFLTEDSEETMQGIFEKSIALVENTCAQLHTIWENRRADPALILQPKQQWSNSNRTSNLSFKGIKPGKHQVSLKQLIVNPTQVARMQAASFNGSDKDNWKTMD